MRRFLTALLAVALTGFLGFAGSTQEAFPSSLCLAGLQYVDGLGELSGAPRAAAELAEDSSRLELGVRALAG